MPPAPRAHRPRRRRRPVLEPIARLIEEKASEHRGHVAAYVRPLGADDDEIEMGLRPLADQHPLAALAGFTAPPEWAVFGIRALGTAHFADRSRPSVPNSTTFVISRSGQECSLMRNADEERVLAGPVEGLLPDVSRRVLELPTAPAPPSTAGLFTVAWLDRVMEALGDPRHRSEISRQWRAIAALHPATSHCGMEGARLDEPAALVNLAHAHATDWPWRRLRAEPAALPLPDGQLPTAVTAWMDDGFYARWAFGAFPPARTLGRDLMGLLDEHPRLILLDVLEGIFPQTSSR